MSDDSALTRLRTDLQRPFGGYTVGMATLVAALAGPAVGYFTWSVLGIAWMAVFLLAHIVWGSAGYYPQRVHR